jgi:hypothetical protein
MSGAIPSLLQYAFMAWCLVKKKHRDFIPKRDEDGYKDINVVFSFQYRIFTAIVIREVHKFKKLFHKPNECEVEVFWVVTPLYFRGRILTFRRTMLPPSYRTADECSQIVLNVGILPQHCTVSQPTRPGLASSSP